MLFNKLSDYEKDAINRYIDYYTFGSSIVEDGQRNKSKTTFKGACNNISDSTNKCMA